VKIIGRSNYRIGPQPQLTVRHCEGAGKKVNQQKWARADRTTSRKKSKSQKQTTVELWFWS